MTVERASEIPAIEVNRETAGLLQEIFEMGDHPSDDLLRRLIPNRKEFVEFLQSRGVSESDVAKEILGQLESGTHEVATIRRAVPTVDRPALTKIALARQMAQALVLSNQKATAFLDLLAETAIRETKKNGVFVIPGLGRLVKAERKARVGRNPQTGEAIKIKSKSVVKFRIAKSAKDSITPKKSSHKK